MVGLKIAAVFIMSASIGVLYRVPRRLLFYVGMVGVLSWLVVYTTLQSGGNIILADFMGSIVIGIVSELLARMLKKPAAIFIIPGFIPLVPGGEAFSTIRFMVDGHYAEGVAMGMKTLMIGGAIAFGIFVSSTVYRLVINYSVENNTDNAEKS
ncbi:hypothetical protein SDC9_22899 [bioreactor metagenome]|uniref:Threonine/Serine exporter ThrE domain-containing protein n=1 Tax=bioreactor metagenome TaxID=1076179 RepID=A0A644UDI0_9ZZZZ|nr:threonine/serine exporter family protein [Negativicutes bacterium]